MSKANSEKIEPLSRDRMNSYYLNDPTEEKIQRTLNGINMEYFYVEDDLQISAKEKEGVCGCLLSGEATIVYKMMEYELERFDFFFLPPDTELELTRRLGPNQIHKICLVHSSIDKLGSSDFQVAHYGAEKFIDRGEHGNEEKMATFRTVWTAIKNEYYMAGFTNIPPKSLQQGVITSVNLEENESGRTEVYPHIHPGFPEVYIMCIDDPNYSVSQYMINVDGESVCRDLSDGEGLFFPGSLGHSNFARPFYKDTKYCMYMWIIPSFGKQTGIEPITLRV
ncbi:MAG: hypothetical protein R6U96_13610 [Promethearchaeia archaeon]